jgi:hypothetical protein
MGFKYRWKNGAPPSRDEAARRENLLDENQFDNKADHELAEGDARKHLGIPTQTLDGKPVLPQVAPPE